VLARTWDVDHLEVPRSEGFFPRKQSLFASLYPGMKKVYLKVKEWIMVSLLLSMDVK